MQDRFLKLVKILKMIVCDEMGLNGLYHEYIKQVSTVSDSSLFIMCR